jgi:hypothetical protein
MGCDAYASQAGEFVLVVRSYDTGEILAIVELDGLQDDERIAIDVTTGRER